MIPTALTLGDVWEWLDAMSPTTVVGTAKDSCDCPLQRFLCAVVVPSLQRVTVGASTVSFTSSCYHLAEWAQAFVEAMDALADVPGDFPITAEQALMALTIIRYEWSHFAGVPDTAILPLLAALVSDT
ncbi:MAG: hypothetical protein H0U76_11640 [Ktedonobacteraceae bacterium]|nr:hypothetical protein [Ktedonobacteraceae bacterium]MBA3826303.1 hypothetical protein [Ktedonobacterales bacterium]